MELPLKFMMMGDYTLRADDTPLEERKPDALSPSGCDTGITGE